MPAISIQHRRDRQSCPWVVRYADAGTHRSRSFRTKAEAQVFAAQIRTDQAAGSWVSPDAGRIPVARWAEEWLAAYVGRAASTQLRARSALNAHILPRFGHVDLVDVTRFAVQRMVHEIVASGLSPSTAERAMRTLSLIMDAAVDARLLRDNPCRGVKAPRGASRREPRFLTPAEVEQLAAVTRPPYALLVRFAAYTGLRWGEIGALHVADVDLLRRSIRVGRSLERGGTIKDTKTHTRRTVHLEPALAEELAAHLAARRAANLADGLANPSSGLANPSRGRATTAANPANRPANPANRPANPAGGLANPSANLAGGLADLTAGLANRPANLELVWTSPQGGPLDYPRFRSRVWLPAVRASGLEPQPRFHDLRHTCASWLIARGGSPRAVMAWMGHSTIKVTFDRYGHLFPHELAELAAGLADLRADPQAFGRSSASSATVTPINRET